jgi:hypothetical protein
MVRYYVVIALLLASARAAFCQVHHGTVGVIYFTGDKIVMAADSRDTKVMHGQFLTEDSACKVASLGGDTVYVASGAIGYSHNVENDPVPEWLNIDEAHRAYTETFDKFGTGKGHVEDTANEWGSLVAYRFNYLNTFHPELIGQAQQVQTLGADGAIAAAMFGGVDKGGNLVLFQSRIKVRSRSFLPPIQTLSLISQDLTAETMSVGCPKSFCAIGEIEIFKEFIGGTSQRAMDEARTWKPPKRSRPENFDILKTMRFVELTISLHGVDVGGPIDALQLNKDGTVRWFARKKNCPAS